MYSLAKNTLFLYVFRIREACYNVSPTISVTAIGLKICQKSLMKN